MKKIKLENGLTLEIDDNVLDDMELLDELVAMDEGDWHATSKVLERIVGKEQKKKLYDSVRDENGKVTITKINEVFMKIFEKLGEQAKN